MKSTALLPVLCLLLAAPAHAVLRLPSAPSRAQYVVDLADVISWEDEAKIQQIAERLEAEGDKQLVVVTLQSMAEYGGAGMRIEDFAARLFQSWRIGHPEVKGLDYNRGLLLLVSVADRQSRIELGSGWRHEKDADSERIMRTLLIPAFKDRDYSGGLALGVHALDRMARDLSLPSSRFAAFSRLSGQQRAMIGGGGMLALASFVSLFRSGVDGWGGRLWSAIFSVLGWVIRFLFSMLFSSSSHRHGFGHHHHGSRGGFFASGGSSSSGGSSGGGASGSW